MSLNELNKRLSFIKGQPLSIRQKLSERITDTFFWKIANVIVKSP